MSAVAEASQLIQTLAHPWQVGDSVKCAINRAARKAHLPSGLAKRLWYGEVRRVDSEVMDRLRDAAADALALKEANNARRTVLERLAACEAALGLQGEDEDGAGGVARL